MFKKCPICSVEFREGLWTVTCSDHNFSSIAIDQAHEQTNKQLNGDRGAIGLCHDRQSLTQFLIVKPELARILSEFESMLPDSNDQ